jgi:hypothetical protein
MSKITTAKHEAPQAAAELEMLASLGGRCTTMADRLTEWLADAEFIEMLIRGYGGKMGRQYPAGAEYPSEVLNELRKTRDALRDAAVVLSDA